MYENIRLRELPILIKVMHEESSSLEETDLTISLIDDLLRLQKNKLLLNTSFRRTAKGFIRKSKSFMDYTAVIEGRIGKFIEDLKEINNNDETDK